MKPHRRFPRGLLPGLAGLAVLGLILASLRPGPAPWFGSTAPETAGHSPLGHNCRFWACASLDLPAAVLQDHLIDLPNSIRNLSSHNPHGWSLGHYPAAKDSSLVRRSFLAANEDPDFEIAVAEIAGADQRVAVAHIRSCSSGLCGIPNPHPFARSIGSRHWLFGHNGAILKSLLLELIRPEFLLLNPPDNGADPTQWIDSELYFLFLLQNFEDFDWRIKPALGQAIFTLRHAIPGDTEALNFFLTDGDTVWAYREGNSLFLLPGIEGATVTAVASQHPDTCWGDWIPVEVGELVTLVPGSLPVVEPIETFMDLTGAPSPAGNIPALTLFPNPFNPQTTIRFSLPQSGDVSLAIYDLSGRRIRQLLTGEHHQAGTHAVQWAGKDARGRQAASGVYICRLQTGSITRTQRLVMAR